jgi:DNA-binding CsgD family transcriptional regulator
MAAFTGHGHVRSMLHGNLSERCIWLGQYAEAAEWIRRELDLVGAMDFTSLLSRLVLQGLRAEAGLPRPMYLPRLLALLEDMSGRPDPPPDAAALIVMCWAEVARIRGEPDPDQWDEVAEHWTKLEMPWPLGYSRWRQAETLLAGRPSPDQRRSGATALSEAYAIATRLGAEPLRNEVAALAHRSRLSSLVTPAPRSNPDDLTARERDVLDLICAGATNRRIAQQLFISEKTVSIHVSRILAKLNATNRAEAAAIARRRAMVR